MDYVIHGEIQGRSMVFFKAHCPCILPCLTVHSKMGSKIHKNQIQLGNISKSQLKKALTVDKPE